AHREVDTLTFARGRWLGAGGRLTFYAGDVAGAIRPLEESTHLLQHFGDGRGLTEALAYLSVTTGVVGDAVTARAAGERAVATSKNAGDDWAQGLALWALGTNYALGR